MNQADIDQTIALAALFQAAHLVQQVARTGSSDTEAAQASIYSLFQTHPESIEDVFNGLRGVETGLHILIDQLSGKAGRDMELTRYVIALIQLERKVSRDNERLHQISNGLEQAKGRLEHFDMGHPNMLAQLAGIYSETISTLQPRIMVQGEPLHLNNPDNVSKIRSLLLAGIRAAMLWRQRGGNRWRILWGRKRLLLNAHLLLKQINQEESSTIGET